MANEFIARNGLIAQNNSVVTGSLTVTQGITGSLLGTASYAEAARTVGITELDSVPINFNITFAGASSGDSSLHVDTTALTYNPSTSTFTTPIISATSITGSLFGTASLTTNVVGTANRILFNSATNTTTTSNNLTWTDSTNLLTLGEGTGTAGTISKLALYTSSYGGYGLGVSPAQLDYVSDGSHVFYKNGSTPSELVRITNAGKVGIGTNDPLTTLHAEGSAAGPIAAKYRSIIYANNTSIGGAYNNAIGLYAEVATTDGIAVYGNSTSPSGYGGYFVGKGYFSGDVSISGSASITGSVTAIAGFIKPGAGSQYLLADGTTTAGGGSGGTSLGLVQAFSVGLQNIF